MGHTTVLDGDRRLPLSGAQEPRRARLEVASSGTLVRFLLDNDLVDRHNLLVFPVIVGAGRRLFSDRGIATG